MRKWICFIFIFALMSPVSSKACWRFGKKPRSGDLIFQTSLSGQSRALQIATRSRWSHMGMIWQRDGALYVFEAVQPVRFTPLQEWIERGQSGEYVIKRLRRSRRRLSLERWREMEKFAQHFLGYDYDMYFHWSDEQMYCSELIWKLFYRCTDIQVGDLQKIADFDLSHPAVKQKLRERYGESIPLNETVISPAEMIQSPKLRLVVRNCESKE